MSTALTSDVDPRALWTLHDNLDQGRVRFTIPGTTQALCIDSDGYIILQAAGDATDFIPTLDISDQVRHGRLAQFVEVEPRTPSGPLVTPPIQSTPPPTTTAREQRQPQVQTPSQSSSAPVRTVRQLGTTPAPAPRSNMLTGLFRSMFA